jgi:hypothetical protein
MKIFRFALPLLMLIGAFALPAQNKLEGRWNLLIEKDGTQLPSWLEIEHSGHKTLVGRFVYAFGSARPVAVVNVVNEKFNFSIPPQWEPGDRNMDFEGELTGETLKGTMVYTDGKKYTWTGTRAPLLKRTTEPAWGQPITLFNGKDLKGWKAMGPNQWIVENGILRSLKSGSNLVSEQTFTNFKLHVEFRYEKGSNSGVYLRGGMKYRLKTTKVKNHGKVTSVRCMDFLRPV